MSMRTSLVTGGTKGIGRAVALRLARAGDRVLVVGRDADRGASVLAELQAAGRGREHLFLAADLSLLGDTARLAALVTKLTNRLDAAVLCAGEYALLPAWTGECLERTVALNFLSRFALIADLLPLLTAADHGRVVLLAAAGQYRDTLDLEALAPCRAHPRRRLASASQFANDLLAVELAERLATTRVDVTCVHPGITRTDVLRSARGVPPLLRGLAVGIQRVLGRSPYDAADTPAYLASSAATAGVTGRFFGPGRREIPVPPRVHDPARRRDLWQAAAAVVADVTGPRVSEVAR